MGKSLTYSVKFISLKHQVGVRKTNSYKAAIKEAEGWVLSGKDYTSVIEWSTLTGNKSMILDYKTVQQQRKARNAYREALKKNLFRNTYVEL
jgi:hypothetical protein